MPPLYVASGLIRAFFRREISGVIQIENTGNHWITFFYYNVCIQLYKSFRFSVNLMVVVQIVGEAEKIKISLLAEIVNKKSITEGKVKMVRCSGRESASD